MKDSCLRVMGVHAKDSKKPEQKFRKFVYIENIAIADVAFEAFGESEEELFRNCALALFEVMTRTKGLRSKLEKKVELKAESLENLLYDWLSRLIYLKDVEGALFGKFEVDIAKKGREFVLKAKASGQKVEEVEAAGTDVKAITKHLFAVEKDGSVWKATVVLDI